MTVRYGLIGCGMMGQEHIRNIALLEGAEVVALADPDPGMREQSAKMAGERTRRFADYKELLADDSCDVYLVATPNDKHHAILRDLIPLRKPILCEKPLCTTADDCRDVMDLARIHGTTVWVAMEYRYMPPVQNLLAERDAGRVGRPHMMAIREHRFPFLPKVADWNRFEVRTGGTLVEKCCHFWDLMRLTLQSDPVRVYASGAIDVNHLDERHQGKVPDIIDNAFVTLDFENGTRAMLDLCMFAEGSYWQEVISLTGDKARLDACVPGPARFARDGKEHTAQLVISDRFSKQVETHDVLVDQTILNAGDHHGSTYFQHQKFLAMVKSGQSTPEVSLSDGLWSVRVGEAAELSVKSGQAVELR